ncbi:GNAT family N-acetyltransferase [Citricoccus nitrophenolicus]|uniref:Ribosomal protein S18 acetylase RimI-like enzyme n=1 Tax=Citricoccus muralis TaxID=169134 RepID=A0A3D9L805_9MICC|nr:N-acetyltransferase [Citricoccus muralis]REE02488.1 ribosomal protein S18 acetylase RimI-like enzyme [Citricoccus muralis]
MPHERPENADPTEDLHPAIRAAGWPQLASRVPGVTVRDARAEDHEAIAHLTVTSYIDGGHIDPEDEYIANLQDVATRARQARVLVGEVEAAALAGTPTERTAPDAGLTTPGAAGTVIAGSVVLTLPEMPMSETAREGELEFRMLAVDPRVQRRGVARALVRAAIDRAEQLEGIAAVVLTTMETMTGAHRLYESEGFVRVPERDWRLSDIGQAPTSGEDPLYWVYRRPV